MEKNTRESDSRLPGSGTELVGNFRRCPRGGPGIGVPDMTASDPAAAFCRRCTRMLPPERFYRYNQSTCRACIVVVNRERRRSDPQRQAKRRDRAARERFRAEVGITALGVVLDGVVGVLSRLDAGELSVTEAQSELFNLAGGAIRDVEARTGVGAGDGLDILTYRKRSQ